jgi:(p)ppGpp synthase/HD superfamily hydrolase
MEDSERLQLASLVLAPYIQKATALIGKARAVGGNQFRHAMATLAILIDYHYTDPVLLKASVVHDLLEDCGEQEAAGLAALDHDGNQVIALVREVTRCAEDKEHYLRRLRDGGSHNAKVLKVADRISNLTDLSSDVFPPEKILKYLNETRDFVLPMAAEVNAEMEKEVRDLIARKSEALSRGH